MKRRPVPLPDGWGLVQFPIEPDEVVVIDELAKAWRVKDIEVLSIIFEKTLDAARRNRRRGQTRGRVRR